MTLTLSMIVKGGLADLKRLQPLVQPHIDEWVVVMPPKDKAIKWAKDNGIKVVVQDFTQAIEPEIIEQMGKLGVRVAPDYRLFNFAAARNAGLEASTSDYVLWLDADDVPLGIENLRTFIEKNPQTDEFRAIYDYARDEEGNRASDHIRERVIKNNGKFEWRGSELGLIHETLILKDGRDGLSLDIPENLFIVKHISDHALESSERNFAALLYEYIKTKGKDPRNTFYLGVEFFNHKAYDLSINTLREFIDKSGSQEDRYHAWIKIGETYHMKQMPESGRNAYLAAIDEMPNYPNAYINLGESYLNQENWAKCIDFTLTGLNKKPPGTKHGLDMMRFTFRPAVNLALAYLQIGKPLDAYKWYTTAYKLNPKHEWVQEYAGIFQEAKDLDEYVRSFVKLGQLSQRLYPKTLSKLAEAVPDELMDQELLMDFKWRYTTPKVWGPKSVVFFCSSAFEEWGPESLEKGCGGSEEAVIQLSKRLVKLGFEVTVFNNCIKEQVKDGVKWVRFERFNPRDIFNVLISWRNNVFTEDKIATKKFIDMHDVPSGPFYSRDVIEDDVQVLVKSDYHKSLFDLDDDKFHVIPNGIDMEQFKGIKKTKNNLVWTSSYDRGLENLLEMWADVKKEVPDATLDIYYGFQLYDTTPWGRSATGQAWKKKMLAFMDQDGITEHGRVGSDVVAEAYKKADVWAYPTSFPEICCITATKAMAAGCVPIATDYAVMKERNQGVMIEGDINTQEVKDKFKQELIALLKDDKRKEEIRKNLDVSKYDWDSVAKAWAELF